MQMIPRAAVVALLVLAPVSAGCHDSSSGPQTTTVSGAEGGDFCDQLHAVILAGTARERGGGYFGRLVGARIDSYTFEGTVTLAGASSCIVDYGLGEFDAEYICIFAEAPLSQRGELVHSMNQLERQVDACIAKQNRFGFTRRGEEMPRYDAHGRTSDDSVWFSDRWRNQDVHIEIERKGDGGRVVLSIDSL